MNHSVVSIKHMEVKQSPYTCIKCGEGSMIHAFHDNDAEHTEDYLCAKCHCHASIPAPGVLASQISTSLLGAFLCAYLFYQHIFTDKALMYSLLEQGSAALAVTAFMVGFGYVFYRAYVGYKLRKSYLKRRLAGS